VEAYLAKARSLEDEFAALVRKHAVEGLECEPKCIDDCMKKEFIDFYEVPECLRFCQCKEEKILKIDDGSLNYASLIAYNEYDL